jgi:hypothetical protein
MLSDKIIDITTGILNTMIAPRLSALYSLESTKYILIANTAVDSVNNNSEKNFCNDVIRFVSG